ncbi:MAG TPA: phosphatase PAP2 family protein [Terriglobales bacterium]|nr:phosphatase PAP2 family protein [Terriglobales bacterium]
MKPRYWHYWISLLLSVALVPVLRGLHLPAKFDWIKLGTAYWLVLAAQSVFVAALLCLIGLPRPAILGPLVERYRREPLRIVLLLLYLTALGWAFTWMKAVVLTVNTVAILEFRERKPQELRRDAGAVLLPALYLFAGFLLVFAYNDIIVSVRFGFAYDATFNAMDRWILHGWSVSDLSHWAVRTFPLPFFRFLEFIYFGMFPQIGAAMILVTLYDGKNRALQLVGTILMTYYLALVLFYLWPSQGPYYLCPGHFSRIPNTLQVYSIQRFLIMDALALWNHVPIHRISTDYFIAFPCMHIAQPLIVMWFLRRWKRMLIVLCAYDSLLIVSILLLEWHYVVDIIGGILVVAITITITDNSVFRNRWVRNGS